MHILPPSFPPHFLSRFVSTGVFIAIFCTLLLGGGCLIISHPRPVVAATLADLPFGAVIQIQGTDPTMCFNTSCSYSTTNVLPYKLVKMQARGDTGAALGTQAGHNNNTYWMLLDNYCWWGSSNCLSYAGDRTYGVSFNATSNTTDTFTNNLSIPLSINTMNVMGNFYNSLPPTIAGVAKDTAIPNYAWEMRPAPFYSSGTVPKTGCVANWTASSHSFNGLPVSFSDSTACTMTSKIGLPSYDEWTAALTGVTAFPTTAGSGYSYCQARFGRNCTGGVGLSDVGEYGLFTGTSTANGQSTRSSANPRPDSPWLRTPRNNTTSTFAIGSSSNPNYTVAAYSTWGVHGVSPSLWLQSSLTTVCGAGTYARPYILTGGTCPALTLSLSNLESGFAFIRGSANSNITIAGSVTDANSATQTVQYQIDSGAWTTLTTINIPNNNSATSDFSSNLNLGSLAVGNHTLNLLATNGSQTSPVTSLSFEVVDCSGSNARQLRCLPFGSVIQVQPQDTSMSTCAAGDIISTGGSSCGTTTSTVLPFRFVKMQARDGHGNPLLAADTYWAFMDNYCWWTNSKCTYNNNIYTNYQSWLGVSGTSLTDYHNNISVLAGCSQSGSTTGCVSDNVTAAMTNNNILKTLDNFYESLPDTIGGLTKSAALTNHSWDMMPMSLPTPQWGITHGTWTTGTYNPNTNSGEDNAFAFSGDNYQPVMTSRIGLMSVIEVQGNISASSDWTNTGTQNANGNGGTYCSARFGRNCSGGEGNTIGEYGLLMDTSRANSQAIAGPANPRPRQPWLRTAYAGYNDSSPAFNAADASKSYAMYNTFAANGVSPSLFLSSTLATVCGAGTYARPYSLTSGDCQPLTVSLSSPVNNSIIEKATMSISGVVTDYNSENQTIQYQFDNGSWQTLTTVSNPTSAANNFTIDVNMTSLSPGVHTLYVRATNATETSAVSSIQFDLDVMDCSGDNANQLRCLPFGAVIQVQGTDTYMCNDTTNCAETTSTVLPYKFVKMEGRDYAGNPVPDYDTFWALLDNYCWWGSADCRYHTGERRSAVAVWNAIGDQSSGTDNTNNLSLPLANNIMNTMGNFYNSLPPTIGGIEKEDVVSTYTWEMKRVPTITNTDTTTKSGCVDNWTAGTYNFNGMPATFSDRAACAMTTKVAMVSYDEWQGGLINAGMMSYPSTDGSGYSYCQARFGLNCTGGTGRTGVGDYNLFTGTSITNNQSVHSASNPRPNQPWLRTPRVSTNGAWLVRGTDANYSVTGYSTYSSLGAMPALWFKSCLVGSGTGTYSDPYILSTCNTLPEMTLTTPASNSELVPPITVSGTVTDPNRQTLQIKYNIDTTEGNGTRRGGTLLTTLTGPAASMNYSANLNLSYGKHTLYVWVCDGESCSDVISREIDINHAPVNASPDPTATNSVANIGAFASYVTGYSTLTLAGTVNDADAGQTLTVQYQIDSTSANWHNATSLAATAINQVWSTNVNISSHYPSLAAGSHTIYVRVFDGYAYTPSKSMSFVLDLAAPSSISATHTSPSASSWDTTPASTTVYSVFSAADVTTATLEYRYSTANNLNATCTNGTVAASHQYAVPANSATTLYVCARDKVGNATPSQSFTYRRDDTKPILSASNANTTATYANDDINAVITATDATSGIASVRYVVDDISATTPFTSASTCASAGTPINHADTITISVQGGQTLFLCATDVAGNYQTWSGTYYIEVTAPITTSNINSTTTWYSSAQKPILTVTETGGSGLNITQYAWNSQPIGFTDVACAGGTTFTSGVALSTPSPLVNGTNTLYICVSDKAGNVERRTFTIKVDTTKPLFTLSPPPNGTTSYLTTTALTITPTDSGGAGVAQTRYATTNTLNNTCTSGGTTGTTLTLAAGINNIYVCVRDNAGNVSTSTTAYNVANVYQINRDATIATPAPTITNSVANIGAFASYVTGYSSLILSGTASDADVGQTLTVQYQIDATSPSLWSNLTSLAATASVQSWSGTINLPALLAAGEHTIYIRLYDGYDFSASKTLNFTLDTTAPTNTATLVGGTKCPTLTSIYCAPPTAISLAPSVDNQSGIAAYRTSWETPFASSATTPSWISGAPTLNLATTDHTTPARTHTFFYQTRDKVANASPVGSINYYVNDSPRLTLNNAAYNHIVTPFTPLILTGTLADSDSAQTQLVFVTIGGVDYQSQAYQTLGGELAWSLVVNAASIQNLAPHQLTNLPVTVQDSAGATSSTTFTGQITTDSSATSEIYLSVIKNTPFSLLIGGVGALNISYGTHNGITVSANAQSEVIVSGQLSASSRITFGVTTLVFTVMDNPGVTQKVEFL